ncbi:putative dimethylaniline monooxygenase [Durotheca rogersii]|uniref:putative dimethylaniline monooxygenase n=1 Tax=Durotheca rogersii TaxID=419775 RepID=UPI0022204FE8|nr:putative dimethylaniline monooxygenase [Durotheca rogersii]KAI5867840.1 putative dimethylaniline monooxygenase [Durotheca rogersii]
MSEETKIRSVAVVGAGAAGAITAAALKAEKYFGRIVVFERRETPGGTWIFDPDPTPGLEVRPGKLPPDLDLPLQIPTQLPQVTPPNQQERYSRTPIYNSLTTNVPDIAMAFSDRRFAYGPFAPHYVPRQYIENYFSIHGTDKFLVLNTTVEDISKLEPSLDHSLERWKLTLRRYDPARHVDVWWEEVFDAVILATGHYSVPYVPQVDGLEEYIRAFPGRVSHSKDYRSPLVYADKTVLVVGNSASGHDITAELAGVARAPVLQSRHSRSRWDGDAPPPGIAWKPVVRAYEAGGRVVFADGTHVDAVDAVIYCTGYAASFPFWNDAANGGPLWDHASGTRGGKLADVYWHTFSRRFPRTLGVAGVPRVLTFRSFEYQAIALARLFAGRAAHPLPPPDEQERWERERLDRVRRAGTKFHDIAWDTGETAEWLGGLFRIAGLGTLRGEGRIPPALTDELVWAIEHIKKYPEPGKGKGKDKDDTARGSSSSSSSSSSLGDIWSGAWVWVDSPRKDLLGFI